jgi:hypothetical protein
MLGNISAAVSVLHDRARRGRLARAALAFGLCLTLTPACSSPGVGEGSGRHAPDQPAPEAWTTYEDGSGISFQHPEGWTTVTDTDRGSVTVTGPGDVELLLLPFFSRTSFTEQRTQVALSDLDEGEGVNWNSLDMPTEGAVVAEGQDGSRRAVALVTWNNTDGGSAGYIYLGLAPEDRLQEARGYWARIIESVSVEGAGDDQVPTQSYETWTDPVEGAFSVEVPSGWDTEGGTTRPCPTLVQGSVTARSPDRASLLYMGDSFPFFTEPVPSLGLGEGATYPHPCGYQSPVADYMPATDYFANYVLPELAPQASVTAVRNSPQLASKLITVGINSYDAGEVEYVFMRRGTEYRGIALAINERISAGGPGNWHVWRLYVAQAPADEYAQVLAHGLRMAQSFAIDHQWAEMQANLTAQQTQIIADMADATSETISEGYWGRQAVLDELAIERSNATLEVDQFVDPQTGEQFTLEYSPEHYWIGPDGTIVGTDTQTQPDVDFRELLQVSE